MNSDINFDLFSMFDQAAISATNTRAQYWSDVTSSELQTSVVFSVNWATFPRGFAKSHPNQTMDIASNIDRDLENASYALRKLAERFPLALAAFKIFKSVHVVNHAAQAMSDISQCSFANEALMISNDFSQYELYDGDRYKQVVNVVEMTLS